LKTVMADDRTWITQKTINSNGAITGTKSQGDPRNRPREREDIGLRATPNSNVAEFYCVAVRPALLPIRKAQD